MKMNNVTCLSAILAIALVSCYGHHSGLNETNEDTTKSELEKYWDHMADKYHDYLDEIIGWDTLRKKISVHDPNNLDLSGYHKFGKFDFCKLEGFGEVKAEPYVLVKDSAEFRIVRRSDDLYNALIFQNMGDYWYVYRGFYIGIHRNSVTMNGPDPTDSFRFIQNDTLYDYRIRYDGDTEVYEMVIYSSIHKFTHYIFLDEIINLPNHYTPDLLSQIKGLYYKYRRIKKEDLPEEILYGTFNVIDKDTVLIEKNVDYANSEGARVMYSPLGEIDDVNSRPRCYGNAYGWK